MSGAQGPAQPVGQGTPPTRAPQLATVIHDYEPSNPDELRLRKGDMIQILSRDSFLSGDDGWWYGKIVKTNCIGLFPHNFITEKNKIPNIPMSELQLGELLGSGASGKVYKGSYQGLQVALKEARGITGRDSFEEFLLEAHTIHTLSHENITSLYGLGVKPDRTLCLVLEYAEGGALQSVLKQYGLSASVITNWSKQIASGMAYIHKRRLIHRDLKSGNVLLAQRVTENCDMTKITLKISDFGTARDLEKTTDVSRIVGTVRWLAPEVLRESQYSRASDVWSFGVVIWELLTGEIPFSHLQEIAAVQYKLASGVLRLHVPETTPEAFKLILNRILQYDRKKRPPFVEILKLLTELESSEFVQLDDADLHTMRIEWQEELAQVARDLIEKEARLAKREKEVENDARNLQQEKATFELHKDEMYNMMLRLAMLHFSRKHTGTHAGTPKPMKRKLTKKMNSMDISEPQNFQHLFHYPNRPEESGSDAMMQMLKSSMSTGAPPPMETYHNRERTVTALSAQQQPLQLNQPKEEQTRRHSDKNMFLRRKKPSLDATSPGNKAREGKKRSEESGTPEPMDDRTNTILEFLDFSKLTRRSSGPKTQISQFYFDASEIPNLDLPDPSASTPRKGHRRTRSWGLQFDATPPPETDPLSNLSLGSPSASKSSSLFNKLPSFGKGKKKKKGHSRSKSWGTDEDTPYEGSVTSSENSALATPSVNIFAATPEKD